MPDKKHPAELRPDTNVLTFGFDPKLSVGSARPAVFRSSTYVFSNPEAAERAFDVMGGRAQLGPGESTDLVDSRFNHPNAEIVEDQNLALEPGAVAAAVFNSGMAAIYDNPARRPQARPHDRLYRSNLRRHSNLHPRLP